MRKKASDMSKENEEEMRPEYDFRGGVRGKHYKALQDGHTVKVHKKDGTIEIRHYSLEDGTVMLAPDVREYFPDSDSVNETLRSLIKLAKGKRKSA
jgi:hypothetical protein